MADWITQNIGTAIVSIALCAVVCAIILLMIRDKKRGKHCCSCDHCAMSGTCHKDK